MQYIKNVQKCRSLFHSTTLVCYIFESSKLDQYKDLNRTQCLDFDWKGVVYDRV